MQSDLPEQSDLPSIPGARVVHLASLRDWRAICDLVRRDRPLIHMSATGSLTAAIAECTRSAGSVPEASVNLRTVLSRLTYPTEAHKFCSRLSWLTTLEAFLREREGEHARSLWTGRGALLDAIVALEENGFAPTDLRADEELSETEKQAAKAWQHLRDQTLLTLEVRDPVWNAGANQLLEAFGRAWKEDDLCGHAPSNVAVTLVFHGLYYYTPRQWAFFRQAQECGFDCVFVVHDDGVSLEFETWRPFFPKVPQTSVSKLTLPAPALRAALTRPAAALRAALTGQAMDLNDEDLRLLKFRNAGEFLRHPDVRAALEARPGTPDDPDASRSITQIPLLYAADVGTVKRYFRLMDYSEAHEKADLGSLPAGRMLLRLHDAVHTDVKRRTFFRLTHDIVRDVFESGYLPEQGADLTPLYMQVAGYFEDCGPLKDWIERANQLVLFSNAARKMEGDEDELARRISNPLRRFPWGDLPQGAAERVAHGLQAIARQLEKLFGDPACHGERDMAVQLKDMREILERGLTAVPQAERGRIGAMLDVMYDPKSPPTDARASLLALVDTVRAFLSPKADEEDGDPDEVAEDTEKASGTVRPLRALDRYLVQPRRGGLHLVTMADLSFPRRVEPVKWPFRLDSLRAESSGLSDDAKHARRLLEARRMYATQSDLYLLHVAMQSADSGPETGPVTLSWVEEWERRTMGPSPFVNLLRKLRDTDDGVEVKQSSEEAKPAAPPAPVPVRAPVPSAPVFMPRGAVAAAHHCRRRFVLQWITGRTVAFRARHHHAILHGNVRNLLGQAGDLMNLATPFLFDAERDSSERKARVQPNGPSAHPAWVLTLSGRKDGKDRLSAAYRYAMGNGAIPPGLDDGDAKLLPNGLSRVDKANEKQLPKPRNLCERCPVRASCTFGHANDEEGKE
jgi:hypothetical protein